MGSKKLPSLQITLMAVFAASWLIPTAVFSFFIFYTYQNAYIEKSDNLIKNAVNVSGVLVMNEIDEAVTKMQKPTYEGNGRACSTNTPKGKWQEQIIWHRSRLLWSPNFIWMTRSRGMHFIWQGWVGMLLFRQKRIQLWGLYDVCAAGRRWVMQKDSDYVEVYIIDNQIYLMRNLYTVKDYKKIWKRSWSESTGAVCFRKFR